MNVSPGAWPANATASIPNGKRNLSSATGILQGAAIGPEGRIGAGGQGVPDSHQPSLNNHYLPPETG